MLKETQTPLTKSQIDLLDTLTDEFVDDKTILDDESVDIFMDQIDSDQFIYEKWDIFASTVSSSAPVISGSSQSPPSCDQNGNSPCASCDCC